MEKILLENSWIKFDSDHIDPIFEDNRIFSFVICVRRYINYIIKYRSTERIVYLYPEKENVYLLYNKGLWLIRNVSNYRLDVKVDIDLEKEIVKLNRKEINDFKYLSYLINKYRLLNKREMSINIVLS